MVSEGANLESLASMSSGGLNFTPYTTPQRGVSMASASLPQSNPLY
ncbi:MAG: hypothetical protein ACMG6E_07040 [Candidatus Roizmanbacteria bacterium]